ncbi:MAG: DHH family phosphoesterase [Candidatus Thermoplasmatota archaeon]|nr:DHH family phosphoesterase [Candidatus Thermoplasmatota archaeon]MCL5955353.1 DHH family phosphoesterase [Candidatus Thermoplasmatota archaeon]
MLKDIVDSEFYKLLKEGAERILKNQYVRVLAHFDGDGGSAAIILTTALRRAGIKFHLGFIKSLDGESFRQRILEFSDIYTIVVDAGSDQAKFIEEIDNVCILDHHFFQENSFKGLNINARQFGIDGTRGACGATMAFVMALAMDEKNSDLLPFLISGVISDKQDIGGYTGLNQVIMEHYARDLKTVRTLNFEGHNLTDGITYSTDPFFLDLSGKPDNVKSVLENLGISPDKSIFDITEDEKRTLAEFLATRLLEQNSGSEAIKYLENDMIKFDQLGFTSKEISTLVDGNAKVGMNSVPIIYFLGDKTQREEMVNNWRIFKTKLIEYAYRAFKEIYEEPNVRYFYAPESEMAGAISGIMMLYLLKQDKPLIGFNVGNNDTKVSGRGSRRQVQKGLNLSLVMRESAKEVGGSGGGHDIAAGAVIPRGKEKQFVETANRLIGEQLGKTTL